MNWLQDLLTNPNSIAHIVALYAFVIAAGVLLGKIKFFGISLGVTFVLFVGILAGHFGFTGNPAILSYVFRTLFSRPKAFSTPCTRLMFLAFYSYKKGGM